MRTITINGHDFKIRPLKRKEVKKLKKDGFDLNVMKPETAEETLEAVFDTIFTKKDLAAIEELDNRDVLHKLWPEVMAESFAAEKEEKNSGKSGTGTTTETG